MKRVDLTHARHDTHARCPVQHLERAAGRPLDRSFSDGARALMAAMAVNGTLPAEQQQQQQQQQQRTDASNGAGPLVQLGSAAPTWARNASR
jgi:hypothetical protein